MARQGLKLPLLIGGATTSKAHTAIKIAPHYGEPVVHVLDASRAVPVTTSLLSTDGREAFVKTLREDYEAARVRHGGQKIKLLSIDAARANAARLGFDDLPQPTFTGIRSLSSQADPGASLVRLEDLVPFIDWTPFFHTWELRGVYPKIFDHEKHGEEARKLFADAQELLGEIVAKKSLQLAAVYGLFPANAVGDDVELYEEPSRGRLLTKIHFLRQQMVKEDGSPNRCLADFIAPRGATAEGAPSPADHLGAFAVTAGLGLKEVVDGFKAKHDDYNAIMAEAIADRLAEAFAEYLHGRVREEWGFGRDENLTPDQLIDEQYRGIRPAPGYPACPDHTEKGTLWQLLKVEENAGIKLTESFAMWPGASVSGFYFSHPEARYFAVGKLGRDQVEEYAGRKLQSVEEAERWLGPWLGY
jgi:5-methyltetrahydrofolate--homocysteine methyltransferase